MNNQKYVFKPIKKRSWDGKWSVKQYLVVLNFPDKESIVAIRTLFLVDDLESFEYFKTVKEFKGKFLIEKMSSFSYTTWLEIGYMASHANPKVV